VGGEKNGLGDGFDNGSKLSAERVGGGFRKRKVWNSFVENWAIRVSVSVQFFTCEIMSSGSTFLWMTKVIRERTMGEVKRTLMRLGGWAPMCCSSTRNSVRRGQRLKLGRSLENCSSAPPY
jgi:hypothetical protein